MAGHADLVLPSLRQPAGVEDRRPDLLSRAHTSGREPDVLRPWAVAALAAQPLGKLGRKGVQRARSVGAGRQLGVGVVTEQALPPNPPQNALMVRPVVARRHPPAPRLGVPGKRKLEHLSRW